ncbi:unnamed protein product [Pleuronectes platessa]|uniref:Reverse transcriptase/retrotransposon-derived protein RNase H-like domain-containing protein n=1 Tax=Pleuronectes platessa TaxID=8262 RepID=A0A9N7U1R9_PLEPL|nr:unnamed protein product [Pleuronectes platessa]
MRATRKALRGAAERHGEGVPLLSQPKPTPWLSVHCDSSDVRLGAFLMQTIEREERVFAFASRVLHVNELRPQSCSLGIHLSQNLIPPYQMDTEATGVLLLRNRKKQGSLIQYAKSLVKSSASPHLAAFIIDFSKEHTRVCHGSMMDPTTIWSSLRCMCQRSLLASTTARLDII